MDPENKHGKDVRNTNDDIDRKARRIKTAMEAVSTDISTYMGITLKNY